MASRAGAVVLVAVFGWAVTSGVPAAAAPRPFGDVEVLAKVPTPPGFPEGIAVQGNRVYVAGPATFGTTGKPLTSYIAQAELCKSRLNSASYLLTGHP